MSVSPGAAAPLINRPSLSELFSAFVIVSISGFGGALPWARRMIVEQRHWMSAEEFNEAFALSQFLPGPFQNPSKRLSPNNNIDPFGA